jgi:hypothetical protein
MFESPPSRPRSLRTAFAALILSLIASQSAVAEAQKESKFDPDVFGIGINFDEICDLHSGASISDKCYGFVGAVIEIVKVDSFQAPQFRKGPKTCIPSGADIKQIFERIRPLLRERMCAGFCTQTGYIMSSLREAYPCND